MLLRLMCCDQFTVSKKYQEELRDLLFSSSDHNLPMIRLDIIEERPCIQFITTEV